MDWPRGGGNFTSLFQVLRTLFQARKGTQTQTFESGYFPVGEGSST